MRPVVLSVIDGKNFILGTFDTTSFQSWWKSKPFPGAIDIIQKPIHVYGQYHVCIVKMLNGTYSIYRTKDMGKTWESVYNTSDIIYTLTTIDYGWIVGSTSSGWIESRLDSGYTWSEISSFAPNCKTVINIGDDYLFAHDGTSIWKSEDYARTWSKVLTKTSWYSQPLHEGWSGWTFSWNGDVEPALAGINETIFVGFGPYLIISDDLGNTWTTHPSGWNNSAFNMPNWGNASFSPRANNRILQIIVTEGAGLPTTNSGIMLRNLVGYSVNYMYSGPIVSSGYSAGWQWSTQFSQPFNSANGMITSYDVQRPGSPLPDLLASFTTYDSENNPIVMYSTDGGYTWYSVNTSTVTVYEGDPAQEIISGLGQQVFDEEYFTTYTWVGSACHNSGKYIVEYNKTVRNISHDMDFLVSVRNTKTIPCDVVTKIIKDKTYSFDVLNKKTNIKTYSFDVLNKNTSINQCLIGGYLQDTFTKSCNYDVVNALRLVKALSQDILSQKELIKFINMRMNLMGPAEKSCTMQMKLVDSHTDQIMNYVERYSPQLPDVRYPNIPYKPVDYNTDTVVL